MSMPKFTAEASLYKTCKHYPLMATGTASSAQVVPQQRVRRFPRGLCTKASFYCNRGYENWCDILDNNCFPDEPINDIDEF